MSLFCSNENITFVDTMNSVKKLGETSPLYMVENALIQLGQNKETYMSPKISLDLTQEMNVCFICIMQHNYCSQILYGTCPQPGSVLYIVMIILAAVAISTRLHKYIGSVHELGCILRRKPMYILCRKLMDNIMHIPRS